MFVSLQLLKLRNLDAAVRLLLTFRIVESTLFFVSSFVKETVEVLRLCEEGCYGIHYRRGSNCLVDGDQCRFCEASWKEEVGCCERNW